MTTAIIPVKVCNPETEVMFGGDCYLKAGALQRHIEFFQYVPKVNHGCPYKYSQLTVSSIAHGFQELGDYSIVAWIKALALRAFVVSSDPTLITNARHPVDTGAYLDDGSFSLENFNKLRDFDLNKDGFLDPDEINQMINAHYQRDSNSSGTLFGYLASQGEFGILLKLSPDTITQLDGTRVKAISFDYLGLTHVAGDKIFKEAAAKHASEATASAWDWSWLCPFGSGSNKPEL